MSKVFEFLKNCKVFFVATINQDQPAVRPFGAVMEYENEIYFSTANTKDVYHQLKKCTAIQVIALKDGTRDWIRINGNAVEINDLNIKQAMLDSCPVLIKRFSTSDCPYFALFKIIEMKSELHTDRGTIRL